MCRQPSTIQLSPNEQLAAEETFKLHCKPVELCIVIQKRAIDNPAFLQRCLRYMIQASRKKRNTRVGCLDCCLPVLSSASGRLDVIMGNGHSWPSAVLTPTSSTYSSRTPLASRACTVEGWWPNSPAGR
ncbi:hypothetical protein CFC21_061849 [Triticum aestivum]|uniref:Uncharacterized protein n=2 Tax=Triticum aestivum TaxID=4565 RepID=A0A3B6JHT8_WHEAT|nr:hypothetical protein CFC21_061849 [Triticum aestivum]